MPRGNPSVWQHHGASYAAMSLQQPSESGAPRPAAQTQPAGAPSAMPQGRGCQSFASQATWSLGTTGRDGQLLTSSLQQTTENKTQFKPPPDDYKRRAALRTDKSNFPHPNEPHSYTTVTQSDFGQDLMKRPDYQRVMPIKPQPQTSLLPVDCNPPLFATQAQTDFSGGGGACGAAARSQRHAGAPGTQRPGYNVITGGGALTNNVFEQWDGRDYRRHR